MKSKKNNKPTRTRVGCSRMVSRRPAPTRTAKDVLFLCGVESLPAKRFRSLVRLIQGSGKPANAPAHRPAQEGD